MVTEGIYIKKVRDRYFCIENGVVLYSSIICSYVYDYFIDAVRRIKE